MSTTSIVRTSVVKLFKSMHSPLQTGNSQTPSLKSKFIHNYCTKSCSPHLESFNPLAEHVTRALETIFLIFFLSSKAKQKSQRFLETKRWWLIQRFQLVGAMLEGGGITNQSFHSAIALVFVHFDAAPCLIAGMDHSEDESKRKNKKRSFQLILINVHCRYGEHCNIRA